MGLSVRHGLNILVILLSYFILTTANYYDWKNKYEQDQNTVWTDNDWKTASRSLETGCCLQPCMIGPNCNVSVADYAPQFKSGFTLAEITKDGVSQKIEYNATTYPIPNECRCSNIIYSLLAVKNDMETDDSTSADKFAINPSTGEITLQEDLGPAEMYSLIVEARNVLTDISTETRLTVARRVPPLDVMSEYSPLQYNGYDEIHHRQKRSPIDGDQITFTLTKIDNVNETWPGTKVDFRLEIHYPGTSTLPDMLVELFAPDNSTTVMILCDVQVDMSGLTSTIPGTYYNMTAYSKLGNTLTSPDWYVIDFGSVTNPSSSTDTITITYSSVMIDNLSTVNDGTYWVSAGAEYDNSNYVWVGQASFLTKTDKSTTNQPAFFVDAPTAVEVGSSHEITVNMQLPYPHSTYNFKVYTPPDSPGAMSVCSMRYLSRDSNFACGNDFSSVLIDLTTNPAGPGQSTGAMALGKVLNSGSRENVLGNISLSFITHVYPTVQPGSSTSLALSLEVDTTTLWVGNLSIPVNAKTSTPVNPSTPTVTSDLSGANATIGQSFSITYSVPIPDATQTGAGSHYVFEVLAPFTTEAVFTVCGFEILSVGRDLPCVRKEDFVPVYSARATGSGPDSATLDIGEVTKVPIYGQSGDDVIQIKATLSPVEGVATSPSSHIVYFGVTVDSTRIALYNETIHVEYPANSIAVTNETRPSFNMDVRDSQRDVRINGMTSIELDMLTATNITYPVMELEFLMPTDVTNPFLHICKVEVTSRGRNLPCLTPEWSNTIIEYISTFGSEEIDRAKLDLKRLCNTGEYGLADDNRAIFTIYLKMLNLDTLTDGTTQWISAGLMYSTTKLWIGRLNLTARDSGGLPIPAPSGSLHYHFQQNSTAGAISIGESSQYSLLMKIPPNEYIDLKIKVNSSGQGLDICMVRVFAAGDNLPCVTDELTTKTYTYHADNGRSSVLLDVGVFKKYVNESININNFFDMDSIIVEVIVTGTAAGNYTFDVEAFLDTAQTSSIKIENQTVMVSSSSYSLSYTSTVNVSISAGEFITNDVVDTNWALGEVKRILFNATVPEGVTYKLDFATIIPNSYVGKLEILDASIFSIGDNLPCIDAEKTLPSFSSDGSVYTHTAQFDLSYTCSWPIKPGIEEENRIVFEIFVRALPNGQVGSGETVKVSGSMKVNDGTPISVTDATFTITDTDTFVDKVENNTGLTNASLIEINPSSNVAMTIGQNLTLEVTITIPTKSQSRFLFDVQMPRSDSACLTVSDIRVIGSLGRNVLDMGPSTAKNLVFTPVFNSTLVNGQQDHAFLDLGIITNTALSHRLKSNQSDDDKFKLEVDIQMADCGAADNGTSFLVSFGQKILDVVLVYEYAVQVSRDEMELPNIVFTTLQHAVSSNVLYFDGIVYHSNTSTAEGHNTSMFVYLPVYQIAPTTLVTSSISTCSVNTVFPDVLEILCPNFFFTDILTFRAQVTVNSSIELSQGFSAADSTAFCEVGTDFNIRSSYYSTTNPADWYPYYTCSQHYLEYGVSAGIGTSCVSALGMANSVIQDCQITGSTSSQTNPIYGRLNGGSAWRPYVRAGDITKQRYIQIYFGNTFKVTQIAVQQSGVAMATSIFVDYSHDGLAEFGLEEISLGSSPSTLETVLVPGAQEAEYIRIYVGNTTNDATPDVSLRFELYGCQTAGTMTSSDICASAPTSTTPSDFYPRSFVVGSSNAVFVCDRSINSDYVGRCQTSTDGDTWSDLDENLASMIGWESSTTHIFGYGQNLETVLRSEDNGNTWWAIEKAELDQQKLSSNWRNAVNVQETSDSTLSQATPSMIYTQNPWGATYAGLFLSGSQKLQWTSTGP